MAEVELETGINPDDPDELVLAVVIDPEGSDEELAVVALGELSEPDANTGAPRVLGTHAYADRHLEDGVLTVDIVSYPTVLRDLGVRAKFPPARDPEAVRVLRVTGLTDHDTLPESTLVFTTPLDELTDDENEVPFVLAPTPRSPA
ncbi:hypothetical protein [Actinophytocola sp.]|uniref:hypothetical protein n=1 Tax=Actinophytocola sp. TaxID=1872138 RepID=UPI00389AD117